MVESLNQMTNKCDDYAILRTIGKGGQAVVKLVEKNGQQFAMKIFQLKDSEKAHLVPKMRAEVKMVKDLQLTSLPIYYKFVEDTTWTKSNGQQRQVCYILMEYIEGVMLFEFLDVCIQNFNMEQLGPDPVIRLIFSQIARALHQLHKAGIAHRDIKPQNIIMTADLDVKLIDLGFATQLQGSNNTGFMKSRLGTDLFMAPELCNEKQPYQGTDADLFAFGLTMLFSRTLAEILPFNVASIDNDKEYNKLAGENGINSAEFWKKYENNAIPFPFSNEFKNLMELMLAEKPSTRLTIVDVLGHPYMRQHVITQEQFIERYQPSMVVALNESLELQVLFGVDDGHERSPRSATKFDGKEFVVREFRSAYKQADNGKIKQFEINGKGSIKIMKLLFDIATKLDMSPQISQTKWKFICDFSMCEENEFQTHSEFKFQVELHEFEAGNNQRFIASFRQKGAVSIWSYKVLNKVYRRFFDEMKEEMETKG